MKLVLDFTFITAFLFNILILFLLAKNSSKELHKRILQIIFLFIASTICSSYAYLHKIKLLFYTVFIFDQSTTTFIGPLLLLYIKSIFLPSKGLIKKNRIHFVIPIIILFTIDIPSFITLYSKTYLFNYIKTYANYLPLIIIYSLVYCIISLRVIQKSEKVIKHNYSNLDGVNLSWVKRFLIGAITIISIDITSTLYEICLGELEWNTLYLTSIGVVSLVIYLGYNGVLQSKVLISSFLLQKEYPISNNLEKKNKSHLNFSKSELDEIDEQLDILIQDQKLFLDENLSLKSFAELLNISDKKLSTILNQHRQVSFYDYVNGYRVENVIEKMKDPSYDKYTLLTIAFESGFNSKTSFNRVFKKTTKLSPSEYKKQLKQTLSIGAKSSFGA